MTANDFTKQNRIWKNKKLTLSWLWISLYIIFILLHDMHLRNLKNCLPYKAIHNICISIFLINI